MTANIMMENVVASAGDSRAGGGLASVTTGDRVSLAAGPRATD